MLPQSPHWRDRVILGLTLNTGVDNPRPPPCVRCRRESKRCEFSATRRKRKPSEVVEQEEDGALHRDKRMMVGEMTYRSSPEIGASPYPLSSSIPFDNNGGSSQPQLSETSPTPSQMPRSTAKVECPPSNVSSMETHQGIRNVRDSNYGGSGRASSSGFAFESGHMMNKTAAELLSPTISNSHDALHLLSEAAGRTEDLNRQSLDSHLAARQSVSSFVAASNSPVTQTDTPKQGRQPFSRPSRSGAVDDYYQVNQSGSIDPHMLEMRNQPNSADVQDSGSLDAVKAWSRLRFVRAGWLTVEDAMAYVA